MPENLGRYEILDPIGEGGFAIVYRGRDTSLDRLVALKELRPLLLQDKTWVRRFEREAKTIARLDHPNIVPIYDVYESIDRLFIVMRLVDNASLEDLILQQGRLGWADVLRMMLPVCAGLHYAHANSILHRDLKPANILIDSERGPMLSDFGLAKLVGEHSISLSVTETGSIVGTPHYIAPEVWEGKGNSVQSDIYALGCILHEAITGEKMFKGDTPPAVMMAHFKPLQLPGQWPDNVPPGVSNLLLRAMAHDPAERYGSAEELAQALTDLSPELVETLDSSSGLIASPFATGVIKTPTPGRLRPTGEVVMPPPPAPVPPATATMSAPPPRPSAPLPSVTVTPAPPPAADASRRAGCAVKSVAVVGTLLVAVVALTAFCAAVGAGLGQSIGGPLESLGTVVGQNIQISDPVTDTVRVPLPVDSAPVRLEVEITTGSLNLTSGAQNSLAEGTVIYNVSLLKPQVVTNGATIYVGPEGSSSDRFLLLAYDIVRTDIENEWKLKIADAPMTLVLNAGTADATVTLQDYALHDLVISQGAATTLDLVFSAPNQLQMNTLDFNAGPVRRVSMTGLAHSRAKTINLGTGMGDYILDFSGQLQNDIDVKISGQVNTLTVIVPEGVAAQVQLNGNVNTIDPAGVWQADRQLATSPGAGAGYTITLDLSAETESLKLRN